MDITFLGATETVTGSKYLLSFDDKKILIDCGLFQGRKELRLRNWVSLPIDPSSLDAVLLTHAHIDHSGYLPLLVKNGFKGPIYCTKGTKDLCTILLPDSGHLQEEEAAFANKNQFSKHQPALPLYTQEEAKIALSYFKAFPFENRIDLSPNFSFQFLPAGHIIGASFIQIQHKNTSLLFTGDMGRPHNLVMKPPTIIRDIDYLVIESTYGNRLHELAPPTACLKEIINKTVSRGGTLVIPSFAVGRAQALLHSIYLLKKEKAIPDIPVYLDSPMGVNATTILLNHQDELLLSQEECQALTKVATYVNTPEESIAIDHDKSPKIILSASGMATGGRVLFHIRAYGPDPKNTILFTGYQAQGTRGERLINGEEAIKIHGAMIPIKAEVTSLSNTSAHADYSEILQWLGHFKKAPKKTFITHGEYNAAYALKEKIHTQYGWSCLVPSYMQHEHLA